MFRKCLANGEVLRLQGNWAFDAICGWDKLGFISPRGAPSEVVTTEAIVEAGCGDMTPAQYIAKYCTDQRTQQPFKEVFTIRFAALWTREGVSVLRDMV